MEKKIIVDKSIQLKALKELEDELDSIQAVDEKVESFLNGKLSEVNKKVDSICSSVNSIQEKQLSKRDVVELLKKLKSDVNNTFKQDNASTQNEINMIKAQISRLEKMIDSTNENIDRFEQRIEALGNKLDSLNIEREQSQNSIHDYTENTARYVASFIEANKSRYSQFGDKTKALLKGIVNTAAQVKRSGADIGAAVKSIVSSSQIQPRSASARLNDPLKVHHYAQSSPKRSSSDTKIWRYMERFRLGRKNRYQQNLTATSISLIILFVLLSYFMNTDQFLMMSLGPVKVMGIVWKICAFLISFASFLLKILLAVRLLSTIILVLTGRLSFSSLFNKTVIATVAAVIILILICNYIKTGFYIPGKAIISWKDIILAQDTRMICKGIREIFEHWRHN